MSSNSSNSADSIFDEALTIPAEERDRFIEEACGEDAKLLMEVQGLLAAHEAMPSEFLAASKRQELESDDLKTLPYFPANPPVSRAPSEKPGDQIGRYKLLQEIGAGGFGTVWMAEQVEPVTRRVALKVIKLGMDTNEVITRFEAERQALAMMDHPNIAQVFDAGATETGRPYFVMELVKGMPITQFCDEAQLGTRKRLELFSDVCSAINHAHQKGVIHRDIKPSNVMVTLHGDKPVVKVIDFGIAKATESKLTEKTLFTRFEQFIGTPVYMSPEQAALSGLDIDTRSDIYALGILLYELLTGAPPFDAQTLASAGYDEMRRIICEEEPQKPSSRLSTIVGEERSTLAKARHIEPEKVNKLIEPDLDWIVMKAIDKDRSRRYETANALALDIQRFFTDEAVSATPPSMGYQFRKFARRHKAALSIAASITVIFVLATIVSLWQAMAAHRARENALKARAAEEQQKVQAQAAGAEAIRQERSARLNAYAADMQLCSLALKDYSLRDARQLLERHIPSEGEEDLRDWEWRYLWQGARSGALFELEKMTRRVCSMVLANDGRTLYGFKDRGEIRDWNLETRKSKVIAPGGRPSLVNSSSLLSISADGNWLAAAGFENQSDPDHKFVARVWNLHSKEAQVVIPMGDNRASSVAIWTGENQGSPRLAAYSPIDGAVRIWDVNSRKLLHQQQFDVKEGSGPSKYFGALAYHRSEGNATGILAIGSQKGVVRLLDESTWKPLHASDFDIKNNVGTLAFSPDGRYLVAGNYFVDPRIWVLDVANGEVARILMGHSGFISDLAFSPDGQWLASSSGDHTIRLWDATSWEERATFMGHENEVWCVAFSPHDERLFSSDKDGRILVWSTTDLKQTSPGMKHTGFDTGLEQGYLSDSLNLPARIRFLDASPDGERFVVLDAPGRVHLLKPMSESADQIAPKEESVFEELGMDYGAAFWLSTDQILLGRQDIAEISLWNPSTQNVEKFSLTSGEGEKTGPLEKKIVRYAFLPREHMITVAEITPQEAEVRLFRWDIQTKQLLSSCVIEMDGVTRQLLTRGQFRRGFSSDGSRFAFHTFFTVEVYNAVTGEHQASVPGMESSHGVQGMTLSPDGKLLAYADRSRSEIRILEVDTGKVVTILKGHNMVIQTLEFSADGKRLLSSTIGADPFKLWDTQSWQEVARFESHTNKFNWFPWILSHGNTIAAIEFDLSDDNALIRYWRAPSWKEIEKMNQGEP